MSLNYSDAFILSQWWTRVSICSLIFSFPILLLLQEIFIGLLKMWPSQLFVWSCRGHVWLATLRYDFLHFLLKHLDNRFEFLYLLIWVLIRHKVGFADYKWLVWSWYRCNQWTISSDSLRSHIREWSELWCSLMIPSSIFIV